MPGYFAACEEDHHCSKSQEVTPEQLVARFALRLTLHELLHR
jgi:hypothetical protein